MDKPLPENKDGRYSDYDRRSGLRRRSTESEKPDRNRLTVAVAVSSLLLQLGGVAWYGGRLEQRVSSAERDDAKQDGRLDKQEERIEKLRGDITQQSNAIAATNVAYADIIRRLQSIESKLDRRRD